MLNDGTQGAVHVAQDEVQRLMLEGSGEVGVFGWDAMWETCPCGDIGFAALLAALGLRYMVGGGKRRVAEGILPVCSPFIFMEALIRSWFFWNVGVGGRNLKNFFRTRRCFCPALSGIPTEIFSFTYILGAWLIKEKHIISYSKWHFNIYLPDNMTHTLVLMRASLYKKMHLLNKIQNIFT